MGTQADKVSEVSDSGRYERASTPEGLADLISEMPIDGDEESNLEPDTSVSEETPDSEESEAEDESLTDVEDQEEDGESEKSPESDDDDDGEEDLPPAIRKMQKRINKLTARFKEAEERNEALAQENARLREAGNEKGSDTAQNEIDQVLDPRKLDEMRKNARDVMSFARKNRDGFFDEKTNVEYSAEEMAGILSNAEKMYYEDIPAREKYLGEFAQANQTARKHFPWLSNVKSPEFKAAQRALGEFPEIKKRADWPVILGDLVEGQKLREKGAVKSKTKPKQPPVMPGKSNAIPKDTSKELKGRERVKRAINDPTPENLSGYLEQIGIT